MKLLARGRDCDVFDVGGGTVLRRQRDGRSLEAEATVMRHVASHGFPCPAVHRVDGPEMVLDLLEGPTMAQQLLEDPTVDRVRAAGAVLAELHGQLHRVPPLVDGNGCALHLDLHPENVVLTPGGPVVIDWTNAADGPPELDIAMTWVILEPLARVIPLVRDLVDAFLDAAGPESGQRGLVGAVARRLADPNVTDDERAAVEALLHGDRPG